MKNFLLAILFLSSTCLWAQTKVSGEVKDEYGEPVGFANVIFKDSNEGTITNENGRFYLESENIHDGLWVSFVGYELLAVPLEKRTTYELTITLKEEASALDEVVIFSGKTSKKDNPAITILKKIWENRRENGVKKFKQYSYDKYEKLEFDINTIDSSLIKSKIFKGMEFVWDQIDTSKVTGNSYLPIFINEAFSKVYGDNLLKKEKEILEGNKNSGFENNQTLIAFVKDLYKEYNVYDNYLKFFDKAFTSPLSRTGVDVYNYVLLDSAYRDNKWCYNIVYYPRRKNELTFKGDFWVNDTTWAIKEINLQASKSANLNWVREVYIEQEFDVLNDSIFLITRDYFLSDFSFRKKEDAQGIYGKRTTLFDNYTFDVQKEKSFYTEQIDPYQPEIYDRSDSFWEERRLEKLNKDEQGVYAMLDTLKNLPRFKALYNIGATLASGYYQVGNVDVGPVFSIFGFNEAEGMRIRLGGRTYFSQNDPWRLEVFGAYGFKDHRFKYGVSGKWLLDRKSRFTIFGGNRKDVEQTGASLTSSTDVLGRNLASSSLISIGANDRLTRVNLSTAGFSLEPVKNLNIRVTGSFRTLKSATKTFSLDYFDENGNIQSELSQSEIELGFFYTPKKKTSGYSVERTIINDGEYPSFFLGYTYGTKGLLGGDFEYSKVQALYTQPWNIGGLGKAYTTIEIGKTFDEVPLALLNPVPGNQTLFSIYNTFTQLDYYEFVSDTYASFHFQHNFGGRVFSRIPFLRKLNLREIIGFRTIYGNISQENIELSRPAFEVLTDRPLTPENLSPSEELYWEWSVGIGNIFRVFRIDFNFRGNYLDNPGARDFGVTGVFGFSF
ncbi:MAG: carboxypeptidase-like regulatory domain-containing protein [Flavobacteriaceae bacterium]|nr:carboxypeptidase-like regulatory domain-containing protein [Flavobacteriaceae bacterium]